MEVGDNNNYNKYFVNDIHWINIDLIDLINSLNLLTIIALKNLYQT